MATDLGRKYDYDGMCCMPASGEEDEIHYPSTYIESEKKLDIPEKGKITFEFVRTEKTEKDRHGKETFCYSLDLKALVKVTGGDKTEAKAGDILDALLKEARKSEDY